MKCPLLLLPGLMLMALALPGAASAEENARVIVRFKPAADSVRAKAMALNMNRTDAASVAQTRATALGLRTGVAGIGGGLRARLSLDERTHVFVASGQSSAALARRLALDPEVEFVAVDQRRKHTAASSTLPNDPLYGGAISPVPAYIGRFPDSKGILQDTYSRSVDQWYLKAPSSTPGGVVSSIDAPTAWNITTGSASIIVAVLDTGVRMDHPDLAGQFVGGYDMVGLSSSNGVGTANDGDGADADASDPGDWVSQADIDGGTLGSGCDATDISNSSWHGTRVSGLIAANTNNAVGMAGVSWGIRILPVRVLGKCGGYDSDIMAGMKWATGISVPGLPANPNVAKVLNMSLGGTGSCAANASSTAQLYRDTIAQVLATGATIVAAAGNSAGQAVGLPGNCPGVIAVAALRHVGSKVGFSSVGSEVAIAAPGGNCINLATGYPCLYPMVSTTNSGKTTPLTADDAYTGSSASVGTSFSAPIVSGTVALMLSARPSMTSTEVLALIRRTARPFVTTGGTAGTAQCVAPTSAEQLECYCSTATCGAGMLDAGAAVTMAQAANNGESVVITTTAGVIAGGTVTVDATGSSVGTGRTVASIAWSIIAPGAGASFSAPASTLSTSLSTTTAGSFTVKVVLTDDIGILHSNTASVTVAAAPVLTPPATSGGGGGGGAFSASWLMLLALASWALAKQGRRQQKRLAMLKTRPLARQRKA
ncbi:S8 family peptidase [soil metagenome]